MIINMTDKNGIILKTAGKYCSEDILVSPSNQIKRITENGIYNPDDGHSGFSTVVVDVDLESQTEKAVAITSNGVTTIFPDDNYTGMSKVVIEVNIPINGVYSNGEGVSF